jgi:hypothetical protein
MKLIKPSYEIINDDILSLYFKKDINLYYDLKTVYLTFPSNELIYWENLKDEYYDVYKYDEEIQSKVQNGDEDDDMNFYVTTSHSVLLKNSYPHKWTDDLKYQTTQMPSHEKRISVKFSCDRLMCDKLLQLSKEYKMVFNILPFDSYDELEYIIPNWSNFNEGEYKLNDITTDRVLFTFLKTLYDFEENYNNALCSAYSFEQLKSLLPNAIKTEIILTSYEWYWKQFCKSVDLLLIKELEKELNNFN